MLPAVRKYLLAGLSGTPDVLDTLLMGLPADAERWDARPDPARFSLREIVAHLADWEPIFVERLTRMRDEETPILPDKDEGQMAIDRDYAHSAPHESLRRFREGRARTVALLSGLTPEQLEREGNRPELGVMTIGTMALFILCHDGYHTGQVSQWLR